MTTRIDTNTPARVGTVYQTGRIVSCMAPNGSQLLLTADSERHAEYQASVLRGLLADAYLAGQADERAHNEEHMHTKCDETITTLGRQRDELIAYLGARADRFIADEARLTRDANNYASRGADDLATEKRWAAREALAAGTAYLDALDKLGV